MASEFSIVMTTTGSPELSDALARALLEEKLAACVQIMPIASHYVWDGAVRRDAEQLMFIKSKTEDYAAIAACIRRLHDYETPEIIQVDIADGDGAYLDWIRSVTRPKK